MQFQDFFRAIYGKDADGNDIEPFPWQNRLARTVVQEGWPAVLDLPTAVGKTSALDIAVFHLVAQLDALGSDATQQRTAPLRIFLVVDRRIVVDSAFRHARRLGSRLHGAVDGPLVEAARLLRSHFDLEPDAPPLHVSLMRGGMYRDDSWTTSPIQPTICVSTVDQIGSRLLFRGYGVSPSMRPVHAGLVANDSLMLIDEAHLSAPFLQTVHSVVLYANERFAERPVARRLTVVQMSATTPTDSQHHTEPFRIDNSDREHPVLRRRLNARKIATFAKIPIDKDEAVIADKQFAAAAVGYALAFAGLEPRSDQPGEIQKPIKNRKGVSADEVFPEVKVVGIVVNRVRTARIIFDQLKKHVDPSGVEFDHRLLLLTGRIRPFDRDNLLYRAFENGKGGWLARIESGRTEQPPSPVFVVATQTVEVGADLDFDALVTELAPLDCLRQRFGRLDRRGDRTQSPAVVLGRSTDVAMTAEDRVYGDRLSRCWRWLDQNATGKGKSKSIDFGIRAMEELLRDADLTSLCAERIDAPILLPPYIELWTRTNPAPTADPDIGLFLHGPETGLPDVQVVWRADLLSHGDTELRDQCKKDYISTVALLPPNSLEACSVPVYEVRRWLCQEQSIGDIADVEGGRVDEEPRLRGHRRSALRWLGPDNSEIVRPSEIRPGDTIIVPSSYGGHDKYGWNPADTMEVSDVAESCSRWGRARPVVRWHPNLLKQWKVDGCGEVPTDEMDLVEALERLGQVENLPSAVRLSCGNLVKDRRRRCISYETDGDAIGWLLESRQRLTVNQILNETRGDIADDADDDAAPDSDDGSSFIGSQRPVSLDEHTAGVLRHVEQFITRTRLTNSVRQDLQIAAMLHDVGKIDERFQTLLHDGDQVEAIVAVALGKPLAKSGRTLRDRAAMRRARLFAGVPDNFRHEALSVILLRTTAFRDEFANASDPELVLYLIGSHHGYGRPSHPVVRDEPPPIDSTWHGRHITIGTEGQLSAAIYRLDADWEGLFTRVNRRYGAWGLAWLEAIFRLADHRQSAIDAMKAESDAPEATDRREVAAI